MAQEDTTRGPVPVPRWGHDHWTTFGYAVGRIVEHGGVLDARAMRTDASLHPGLGARDPMTFGEPTGARYPTRLREGKIASPHDDWSCLDDAEAAGLLTNVGTGIDRRYELTALGKRAALALAEHRLAKLPVAAFSWYPDAEADATT